MGFSSGISMPLSLDPGIGSMGAAIASRRERQEAIDDARKEFIQKRIEEMVEGEPTCLAIAAHYAVTAHKAAFGIALKRLMEDGTVQAILHMDGLLRKAAEEIAQAEWLSTGEAQ